MTSFNSASLATSLGPLTLKNPIVVAAGTFGYGVEFQDFVDLSKLGAIITKTLTLAPRAGNPAPRVVETPAGMLNAVGLQNVGIEEFAKATWPALQKFQTPIIISVAGFKPAEYADLVERADALGPAAIELNLSCPNVEHGPGARCFAQSEDMTSEVLRLARARTKRPLLAKLSAEVADLPAIAKAALAAGADILSLINTIPGMVIDVKTRQPALSNVTGGLSGPAIRPIAVRCVWEVYKATKAPILGLGGILSGRDAIEFMLAGASAVAVGTASFWNPSASEMILRELSDWAERENVSLRDCVGSVGGKKA
jgi:dihydroorotate dehydrogenase (NAD+) catalytic subunit